MIEPSIGYGYINLNNLHGLSMRNFYRRFSIDYDLSIAQIALLCSTTSEQINLAALPGNGDYSDSLKVEADVPASVVERRADVQAAYSGPT